MLNRKHLYRALSYLVAATLVLGNGSAMAATHLSDEDLVAGDARLALVGYRLASANADRCDVPMMITGLTLHDLAGYGLRERPLVQARGLGTGFAVRAVVAGSAADRAGLLVGDELVAINGRDVTALGAALIRSRATYKRVELFNSALDTMLSAGPAVLTVQRGTTRREIVLTGDRGCGGTATLQPGSAVNAWADGRYVAVTTRALDVAAADDELAFVVAHEMAHNMLHHRSSEGRGSSLFPRTRRTTGVKQAEIEADELALRLIARAGYDTAAPERFLRRVAPARWTDLSITHPSIGRRIQLVNAVRDEIDRARIGQALAQQGYVKSVITAGQFVRQRSPERSERLAATISRDTSLFAGSALVEADPFRLEVASPVTSRMIVAIRSSTLLGPSETDLVSRLPKFAGSEAGRSG